MRREELRRSCSLFQAASLSVVHVPDSTHAAEACILFQYLLTAQGNLYELKVRRHHLTVLHPWDCIREPAWSPTEMWLTGQPKPALDSSRMRAGSQASWLQAGPQISSRLVLGRFQAGPQTGSRLVPGCWSQPGS